MADPLFRVVQYIEPDSILECSSCKHEFYADVSTTEGFYLGSDGLLRFECPRCGLREPEESEHGK